MKPLISLILAFLFAQALNAQTINPDDSIKVVNSRYVVGGKEYYPADIRSLLENNVASYKSIEISNSKKTWAYIDLVTGLVLLTYCSSHFYYQNRSYGYSNSLYIAGAGLGLVLDIAAISLFRSSSKYFDEAIEAYNKDIYQRQNTGYQIDLNFRLNGISLALRF